MIALFIGEYNHTIDTKGRLIIPSKFCELLGEQVVATRGLDGCLFLSQVEEWKSFEEKLRNLPLADKKARKLKRFFASGAAFCDIDKQGRVLIPVPLREFAEIDKDVILIGAINRIELWDKERYREMNDYDDVDDIIEELELDLN